MPEESIIPSEVIQGRIYSIRGLHVMLDRDLAELYDVRPIRLREQVKRNSGRFPDSFMFRLTEEEAEQMVSQNAIPSRQHLGGALPYAFTEHGILQLSNVLRSGRAVLMSIRIIEVFVRMREVLSSQQKLYAHIEEIRRTVTGHEEQIAVIFEYLRQLEHSKQEAQRQQDRTRIGFRRNEEDSH